MLTNKEILKYERQLILNEIGQEGQQKLKNSKVLVVGAGGLGCAVLQYLTAAGVGTIGIIDYDTVEPSNLQRQVLYNEDDISKNKAEIARLKLQKQNSLIQINAYPEKLSTQNFNTLFSDYEIIVDCTDNINTRYLINDACVLLDKPMVYGAIHRFEGQVSVFNFRQHHQYSATYRCVFPTLENSTDVPTCNQIGVLGILPGIIGIFQATETIKIITGIGEINANKLLIFNALTLNTTFIDVARNPTSSKMIPDTIDDLKAMDYDYLCKTRLGPSEITPEELSNELFDREKIQFIDVREEGELPVLDELSGLKIPYKDIEKLVDRIDNSKKLILYCKSGKRSASAIDLLNKNHHFENLYHLEGGIDAWLRFKKLKKESG